MTNNQDPRRFSTPLVAVLLVSIPLIAATIFFARQDDLPPEASAPTPLVERNRTITVGGVRRPASDLTPRKERRYRNSGDYELDPAERMVFGQVPVLKPDANPTVARVAAALQNQTNPEQLSPLSLPDAFDRDAYVADPEAYLAVHAPGRVFQSAQPGPNVPVLKPVGRRTHVLRQGETIRLSVRTAANMPVTFTSFDIGIFANGLTSISVAANEEGIAEAAYSSASGKIGEVNILAASPVAAEQVKFDVWIKPAEPTANN